MFFKKEKGVALVMVISVAVIVLFIGLGLLSFVQTNSRLTGKTNWNKQALYSAQAGLIYAADGTNFNDVTTVFTPINCGDKASLRDFVVEGDMCFKLYKDTANNCYSVGMVKRSNGRVLAEKTIRISNSNLNEDKITKSPAWKEVNP